MLDIQKQLESNLEHIVNEIGAKSESLVVELTDDLSHGDLTTSVALKISKELGKNPRDIANEIVSRLEENENIEKVEIAGPGFINFYISNTYLLKYLERVFKEGEKALRLDVKKGQKLMIEFTDPNPFKIFHIGHLYTNAVGESFSRLQEAIGANVTRANYQGDVGLHVAKTLWGLKKKLSDEGISFEDISKRDLKERVKYLGSAYILGTDYYDNREDPTAISEIKDINHFIFSLFLTNIPPKEYSFNTEEIKEMYSEGREWCLEYFEGIYKRFGSKFDNYFFESEVGQKGYDLVNENTNPNGKCVFKKDGPSTIYEGDKEKGLHTRVFINQDGLPTYEAKDLGLAFAKKEVDTFDESVIITANEQTPYFKVLLDALNQLDPGTAKIYRHMGHGVVKLPGNTKMSSRKGNIVDGEGLLDKTLESVLAVKDNINAEEIAVAAIKYAFLKVTVGRDVVYDVNQAISFDGDTGPYLQYVYARCNSILKDSECSAQDLSKYSIDPLPKELSRTLVRFENNLLSSAKEYAPNVLCEYLFDLGQVFNNLYQNVRILDANENEKKVLLSLVYCTMLTMKEGLNDLGIEVVESM